MTTSYCTLKFRGLLCIVIYRHRSERFYNIRKYLHPFTVDLEFKNISRVLTEHNLDRLLFALAGDRPSRGAYLTKGNTTKTLLDAFLF
jgi:hypothetical protein